MKKFLALLMALVMTLALVACGGGNNSGSSAPADSGSAAAPADTSAPADTGAYDALDPVELIGAEAARQVEETALALYERGRTYAAERGIIVADTKFEFGFVDGKIHLIDEVLTPDSSRFWAADKYEPGHGQPSFDKQYLRDWLKRQPWNMQPPPPALPDEVADVTAGKYRDAYRILTGSALKI